LLIFVHKVIQMVGLLYRMDSREVQRQTDGRLPIWQCISARTPNSLKVFAFQEQIRLN
jgi:hypothetical protein